MVCGSIDCAAVFRECVLVVPKVTLFTEAESVPAIVTPELAVLVVIGACASPAVVTEDAGCCMDMPAALEKKGAPVCNRGISCAPVVAACCDVIIGIENDSGRGDV